jgi:hypothetical protein
MNGTHESRWWRVLEGAFDSIDVIDLFGEVFSFVLSSLLEIFSGL